MEEASNEKGEEHADADTIPAIASADDELVGEITLSEGEGEEEAEDEEELPPIDDLLADE